MITNIELFNALRNVTAKREGSRHRILMELYTIGEGISQRVLVDTLHFKPATVSEQLEILINQGLVEKHIDMMDKRISVVSLTNRGREEAKAMVHKREQDLEAMFTDLTPVEKDILYSLLQRIMIK
ncbi:MarR family winged helix-turn-helix transcriptional regulator [Veillonella caviae]|uniref:MarR family winged helix-turn-helix transcriptional regulator n=1 Tax=Veillonella caviae TaxID=248316 RepID=UPI0023F73632|nr:MarR family winged helix-turn-helix transcriptional regulator [Veillonella caviae]MCI7693130.1 MarR family winged helix-turn-helix transcriptional regulator [Veillonella caviae]MDY4745678.1 MarR family winged helix-turn-helix transcriptional regulator [Veillonella caviae]MDY5254682.1 MarR family winged helix-turn-helix transcriptional regulator [Veillonella caviae]MDY5408864.1 MarR family winged helix-turn-helix transcriptional regulator [Veillonella caviae]